MNGSRRRALLGAAALPLALALERMAFAQKFPERPLRIVVGYTTGTTDLIARLTAQQLAERLGQNVIVENRVGATGIIAVESVARSAPDGYTLLVASSAEFSVLPALRRKLSYDPARDFVPLALLADIPVVFVVHPSIPVTNMRQLVEYSRKNPGAVRYGSSGVGGVLHLAGEMLKLRLGADLVHVPYKGGGDMIAAVVAGHIEMIPLSPGSVFKYVEAGQLRALAVASATRSEIMPNVPTMIESGFTDFSVSTWWGIVAPAHVPDAICGRLSSDSVESARSGAFQSRIRGLGGVGEPLGREQFGALIASDLRRWREFGAAARISLEN